MALMSNLTAVAIVGGFGLSRSSSSSKGGYFELRRIVQWGRTTNPSVVRALFLATAVLCLGVVIGWVFSTPRVGTQEKMTISRI